MKSCEECKEKCCCVFACDEVNEELVRIDLALDGMEQAA